MNNSVREFWASFRLALVVQGAVFLLLCLIVVAQAEPVDKATDKPIFVKWFCLSSDAVRDLVSSPLPKFRVKFLNYLVTGECRSAHMEAFNARVRDVDGVKTVENPDHDTEFLLIPVVVDPEATAVEGFTAAHPSMVDIDFGRPL